MDPPQVADAPVPSEQPFPPKPDGIAEGLNVGRLGEEGVCNAETGGVGGGAGFIGSADVEGFRNRFREIISGVNEMEQRVTAVSNFYTRKKQQQEQQPLKKGKVKERVVANDQQRNVDPSQREAARRKRMEELMQQFGNFLRQISQEKMAWPFMNPVDVEGIGLHDYNEIIKNPMDFGTIQSRMEAKDGTRYKNVREIYADSRLVFTNAMTYNNEEHDVHKLAKKLLKKLEEKWRQLLPKINEEERRQKEEEAQVQADMLTSQESAFAKMARDTNNELTEINTHLEELRDMVIKNHRKMSTEEKRKILMSFSKLPPEHIERVLEIIAQHNPNFSAASQDILIDMDTQSESALWRLKFYINAMLEEPAKNPASKNLETQSARGRLVMLLRLAKKRRMNKKE